MSSEPNGSTARRRGLPILAGGAVGVAAALVTIVLVHPRAQPARPLPGQPAVADITWPAGARPAPGFTLTDQNSAPVSLSRERGRVVLLTFMDSVCRTLCPIEGGELAEVQQQVAGSGRPVVVLAVSVDPSGDTPATARAAAAEWGWAPGTWRWLMGTRAQLAAVWRSYGIAVLPAKGDIQHTGAVYVIDAQGDERAGFSVPFDPTRMTAAIRTLSAAPAA